MELGETVQIVIWSWRIHLDGKNSGKIDILIENVNYLSYLPNQILHKKCRSFIMIVNVDDSPEPKPDDFVELSILRQCLENAMASELSPHERDIIRLRLGLDDGKTRTVREVVEVCGGAISMAGMYSYYIDGHFCVHYFLATATF